MKRPSLNKIAKKYGLIMIVLFGSMAKGTTHPQSDVDLAIDVAKPLSLEKELSLRYELSLLYRREIDLVFLRRASPLLLGQIARHGKLLVGKKKDFTALRVKGIKMYIDFKPYFALRAKTVRKAIRNLHA